MTMDVSTLAVRVESTGIKDASKQLNDLADAAVRVDKSVTPAVSKVNSLSNANQKVSVSTKTATTAAEKYISRLELKANTLGKNQAETERLRAIQRGFSTESVKQAEQFGAAIDRQRLAMDKANHKGSLFNNTVRSMVSAFILYKSIGFARSIIESGDAWAMMTSRLKVATGSMKEAVSVQEEVYKMAQNIRVPLEDAARLYTRISVPMQKLGKTSKEVMQTVEGVSLALQLNGSTGAEASSVMLQFSQSMAAGRLNGQELNAVLEGAPPIIRAIEAELARTGQGFEKTGKSIKDMGAAGLLSVDLISSAIANALPKWREDFRELPITLDSALTVVRNSWIKAMGEMSQDTGLNKRLSAALMSLVDIMPMVRDVMVSGISFIIENVKGLTFAIVALMGLKIVGWAFSIGAALKSFGVAAGVATAGVRGLSLALGGLLGPIGLGVTAIGALYSAYKLWYGNVPKQSKEATAALVADGQTRIDKLWEETQALNKRNAEANMPVKGVEDISKATQGASALRDMESNILKLKEAQNKATSEGARRAFQIAIQEKENNLASAKARLVIIEAQEKARDIIKKQTQEEKALNDIRTKYATQEEKRIEAIKEAESKLTGERLKEAVARINAQFSAKDSAKAISELSKEQKAVGFLSDALQEQIEIRARLEKFGLKFESLGEGTKKRIMLERKLNDTLTEAERKSVKAQLSRAIELEQSEALTQSMIREKKSLDDLSKAKSAQAADLTIIQESYDAQLRNMKLGDAAAAHQQKIFAIEKKYSEQRLQLSLENAKAAIPNYDERLSVINDGNRRELELYKQYNEERLELQRDWTVGASSALDDYLEKSNDVAGQSKAAFTNMFSSMEDALFDFVTTGKLNFKELAKSILSDLAKIAIKAASSGIFQMLASSLFTAGTGGGMFAGADVGNTFSTLASYGSVSAKGNAFSNGNLTSKFAKGGTFTNKIVDTPTNFNMGLMGEAGPEAIVPLTRTSDGSLGVKQVGGGSGGDVNIHQVIQISDSGATQQTSGDQNNAAANELAQQMRRVVQDQIEREKLQGGSLWKIANRR